MLIMRMRAFFAAHPKLYDALLALWVVAVTAASVYTIYTWR